MPKKTITNIHKLAIQGLVLQGMKSPEIAKELDVSQEAVDNYIEETRSSLQAIRENISAAVNNKKQKATKRTGRDNYITKGQSGKGGVTIATPTSSERGDKKSFKEYKPRNSDTSVFIIDPVKQEERRKEFEENRKQVMDDPRNPVDKYGKKQDGKK